MFDSFLNSLDNMSRLIDVKIDNLIPNIDGDKITAAMRYSVLSPGKRLRPFLVVSASNLFSVDLETSLTVGAAIEMIHAYSLIHDDLPAIDNDDMRRGQASCHVKWGEAYAILAGNALLTLAFEILADKLTYSHSSVRCALISSIAKAIGTKGMIGGQGLDIAYKNNKIDINDLIKMQRMKTGELFGVATEAGAIIAKAPKKFFMALRGYAHAIGIAFQIMDDIVDNDQTEASFIKLMGLSKAREQAIILTKQAIDCLKIFDNRADDLRNLAKFIIEK